MDVKTIVEKLGGPAAIARALKSDHPRGHVSTAAVSKWTQIPVERCPELVRLSNGALTLADLRPDIFGPIPPAANSEQQEAA